MIDRRRALLLATLLLIASGSLAAGGRQLPLWLPAPNASGVAQTVVAGRTISQDEPFFQSLGTNGRACVTCHVPTEGWSIEPTSVQRLFAATAGRHPLFRPVDGATSPDADVSTLAARRLAYALLLARGVIRVGLPVPPGAEFELIEADDPYGFASAAELSLFRRPLPSTNLAFLSTVMWDGRESPGGRHIHADLMVQASDATVGHAEAPAPLDEATRRRIADFELRLTTAQVHDWTTGRLTADGADGGPQALARQPFWPGINSAADPSGRPPTNDVFTVFSSWAAAVGRGSAERQAVARGQLLFNTRTKNGRAVCSGCHNAPNAGSSSTGAFFDVGVAHETRRTPDVPLYTLRCLAGALAGSTIRTTDPGRALLTGRCSDIGRFKVPTLRALAARPPFFHDGSAARLEDVVEHYERRFGIGLVDAEKADLTAFLRAL